MALSKDSDCRAVCGRLHQVGRASEQHAIALSPHRHLSRPSALQAEFPLIDLSDFGRPPLSASADPTQSSNGTCVGQPPNALHGGYKLYCSCENAAAAFVRTVTDWTPMPSLRKSGKAPWNKCSGERACGMKNSIILPGSLHEN